MDREIIGYGRKSKLRRTMYTDVTGFDVGATCARTLLLVSDVRDLLGKHRPSPSPLSPALRVAFHLKAFESNRYHGRSGGRG